MNYFRFASPLLLNPCSILRFAPFFTFHFSLFVFHLTAFLIQKSFSLNELHLFNLHNCQIKILVASLFKVYNKASFDDAYLLGL